MPKDRLLRKNITIYFSIKTKTMKKYQNQWANEHFVKCGFGDNFEVRRGDICIWNGIETHHSYLNPMIFWQKLVLTFFIFRLGYFNRTVAIKEGKLKVKSAQRTNMQRGNVSILIFFILDIKVFYKKQFYKKLVLEMPKF